MRFLKLLLAILFLMTLCVYSWADVQNVMQDPEILNLIKPFALYVKDIKQSDIYTLIAKDKDLKDKVEYIINFPYIEKEFLKPVIASYISLYAISDLTYIFINQKGELKPVFLNALKMNFNGRDPNMLGFTYKDGYIKENEKVYKNVELLKIESKGKATILSKKGLVWKVDDFKFITGKNWFFYTPYNPITGELNIMDIYKEDVRYIVFSPYLHDKKGVDSMKIESPKFGQGKRIPNIYTCMGKDVSPPLLWEGVPEGTKSFALIADDPDAPVSTWVHWVIYNIPKDVRALPEGVPPVKRLSDGTTQGVNDFRKIGYGGPCPPPGKPHRYFFKLYALSEDLNLKEGLTKKELLKKIEGKIITHAEFYGIFSR